jgi:hypothetical protein
VKRSKCIARERSGVGKGYENIENRVQVIQKESSQSRKSGEKIDKGENLVRLNKECTILNNCSDNSEV